MIHNRAGFRVMYPLWNHFWGWIQLTFGSGATSALNPLNQHHVTILTTFRIRLALQRCHFGSASSRYAQTSGPLGVHWPKAPGISWDYPDTLREHREHMWTPKTKKKSTCNSCCRREGFTEAAADCFDFPFGFWQKTCTKEGVACGVGAFDTSHLFWANLLPPRGEKKCADKTLVDGYV